MASIKRKSNGLLVSSAIFIVPILIAKPFVCGAFGYHILRQACICLISAACAAIISSAICFICPICIEPAISMVWVMGMVLLIVFMPAPIIFCMLLIIICITGDII